MEADHPEKKWLKAYKKGDLAALGLLVEHFRRPLFSFILNMMPRHGDAEEIFQETWLRAIRNLPRFREGNFAGWLFRIARNLIIDQIRREAKTVSPLDQEGQSGIELVPDAASGPDQQAGSRDLGIRIQTALAALAPEQREVFLMRNEAGLSFKEIARLQETTLNTALSRMHYALQKLRPLLQEDYDELERG
jgi:RNA polymerase sigma-70 factor (ECF subfamily)